MAGPCTILLLEDEPIILMDLEFAAEDHGCRAVPVSNCAGALERLATLGEVDVAVLDVSLQGGETCLPVAEELGRLGIPYLLHSGDLDRHDEQIRRLGAELIAKPASADEVIAAAIARCARCGGEGPATD
ncbi:MAG: response regulator [Erythrobacter sp.]|jgi:CheY-like chemotaxis protein|nr:response regulator [Erythrobacter sp.]